MIAYNCWEVFRTTYNILIWVPTSDKIQTTTGQPISYLPIYPLENDIANIGRSSSCAYKATSMFGFFLRLCFDWIRAITQILVARTTKLPAPVMATVLLIPATLSTHFFPHGLFRVIPCLQTETYFSYDILFKVLVGILMALFASESIYRNLKRDSVHSVLLEVALSWKGPPFPYWLSLFPTIQHHVESKLICTHRCSG